MSRARPASGRRLRGFIGIIVTILVVVAVYATTVALYAVDLTGADVRYGHLGDDVEAPLVLVLKPRGLDPVSQRFSFQLEVSQGSGLMNEDGTGLTEPVHVKIRDAGGGNTTKSVEFGPESLSSDVVFNILSPERRLEAWPFDSYTASIRVTVERGNAAGQAVPIDTDFLIDGGIPGWDLASEDEGASAAGTFSVVLDVTRSFSTMVFAIVLLVLLAVMAVIALAVSVSVVRRRRRMELIFLGWIAGMLFAVPALRNFLPGQPPIGSWVDFLVVLWVIVALVISLALIVVSWFRSPRSREDPLDGG